MRDRLEIIRRLVRWIMIDDNEAHYLKVLCDEIFGRVNFISNVDWQKKVHLRQMLLGYLMITTTYSFIHEIKRF